MPSLPDRVAFEKYVAAAARRGGAWRIVAGFVFIAVFYFAWSLFIYFLATALPQFRGISFVAAIDEMSLLTKPVHTALFLVTFIGIWPALSFALRLFHRQSFRTTFSPERRIVRPGEFGVGIAIGVILYALTIFTGLLMFGPPARSDLDFDLWLLWVLPILVLIASQASAEEAIFRGYLLSQLAVRWSSPVVWAVLPSLLFGAIHFDATLPGAASLLYMVAIFIYGLTATVLVWRTGALSAAMGLHFGINICAITLVGHESWSFGMALWEYPAESAQRLLVVDVVASLLFLLFVVSRYCPLGEAPSRTSAGASR